MQTFIKLRSFAIEKSTFIHSSNGLVSSASVDPELATATVLKRTSAKYRLRDQVWLDNRLQTH